MLIYWYENNAYGSNNENNNDVDSNNNDIDLVNLLGKPFFNPYGSLCILVKVIINIWKFKS